MFGTLPDGKAGGWEALPDFAMVPPSGATSCADVRGTEHLWIFSVVVSTEITWTVQKTPRTPTVSQTNPM
jgi:hypothetical protein